MYDMNAGLGQAMSESFARDRSDRLEKRIEDLEDTVNRLIKLLSVTIDHLPATTPARNTSQIGEG